MTDSELLELAAKAAGVCLHPEDKLKYDYGNWGCDTRCTVCRKDPTSATWYPLTDDGDALRLAVKLEINILPTMEETSARNPSYTPWINENGSADPYAATRRAIVRAAAEIGKVRQ